MTLNDEEVFHGLFLADSSVSGSSSASLHRHATEKHSESLHFSGSFA